MDKESTRLGLGKGTVWELYRKYVFQKTWLNQMTGLHLYAPELLCLWNGQEIFEGVQEKIFVYYFAALDTVLCHATARTFTR
jgi:hypothetical protein